MSTLSATESSPPAATAAAGIPTIRRVLLATNFTEVCKEALRHAYSLLPAGGAIRMVHVCDEPTRGLNPLIASRIYFDTSLTAARNASEAEEKFKALPADLLSVPGVTTATEVLIHGDIAAAICEAADRFAADVICLGTKGHSRAGAALLGSTVQSVLARSHKPVFAVPPPAPPVPPAGDKEIS